MALQSHTANSIRTHQNIHKCHTRGQVSHNSTKKNIFVGKKVDKSSMATSAKKKQVRFTMDINFNSEVEKSVFCEKLSFIRGWLTLRGSTPINNHELMPSLFSLVDPVASGPSSDDQGSKCPSTGSFLKNSGKSTIDKLLVR